MRYVFEEDMKRPYVRTKGRMALMTEPYIDEQVEKIAWNSGDVLPLLAKFTDDGSVVVRSKRTGLDYIIPRELIPHMLIEKIG